MSLDFDPGNAGVPRAVLEPLTTILGWADSTVAGERVRLPDAMRALPSIDVLMRAVGFRRAAADLAEMDGTVWIRADDAGNVIRWVEPLDATAVCQLHGLVFNAGFDHALYQWRYGEGRGWGLGAWSQGGLVGYIGLTRRRVYWEGTTLQMAQMGDIMVHPDHRGGLRGLQYRLFALLALGVGGVDSGLDRIFGFPRPESFRLGYRQRLQHSTGRMMQYQWSADGGSRPSGTFKPLVLPRDAGVLDDLWGAMCCERAQDLIGERTASYLHWRYLEHPSRRYCLRVVRDGLLRRPVGVLVFRVEGDRLLLMDVIGRSDSFSHLIAWARFHAAVLGMAHVALWTTAGHPIVARDLPAADHAEPLMPVSVTSGVGRQTPDPTWDGRWWLTAGDIDHL